MSSIEDAKNRILSAVPLADLIGDAIKPQRKSGRVHGLCPFHAEKTPSFHIYDDHYHCFGCKAHGDAITYIQQTQGLGFMETLRWLAQKYGVQAPELNHSSFDRSKLKEKAQKSRILMAAQEFFQENLKHPENIAVLNYLEARGFAQEQIDEFGFGFAPDSKANLVKHLEGLGFKFKDIKECSLANGDEYRSYDFFQNRVMVPIRDVQGRLIAFGGRALGDEPQKYKNSRYDKGTVLFGMDKARKRMRTSDRGIVVEGYLDALQMWQRGFGETVACQGTALTLQHMRLLKNATSLVYLMFDGDSAGKRANLKLIDDAVQVADVDFRVITLPDGEDPDSFIKKNGEEAVEQLFKKSEDLVSYCIAEKLRQAPTISIPDLITRDFIPWLRQIENHIQRDFLVGQLARKTGLSAETLRNQIKLADTTARSQAKKNQTEAIHSVRPKFHQAIKSKSHSKSKSQTPPISRHNSIDATASAPRSEPVRKQNFTPAKQAPALGGSAIFAPQKQGNRISSSQPSSDLVASPASESPRPTNKVPAPTTSRIPEQPETLSPTRPLSDPHNALIEPEDGYSGKIEELPMSRDEESDPGPISSFAKENTFEEIPSSASTPPFADTSNTLPAQELPREKLIQPPSPAPLSKAGKELLGHIYYASLEDIDLISLEKFITNDLGETGDWEAFTLEMLETIKSGSSPHKQEIGIWSYGHDPQIAHFLCWASDAAEIFECNDRAQRIKKIQLIHRQADLKKRVHSLNEKLALSYASNPTATDSWKEILIIINQLSSELRIIQGEILGE